MSGRRPLAVLVSGAPGSGKTTLAAGLGELLRLPVAHKDRIKEGRWHAAGQQAFAGAPTVEPFYRTMELWLAMGVSAVGDMTFWREVSEPEVINRLASKADLINVHCRTPLALARFKARMIADPLYDSDTLDDLMPIAARLQDELFDPLEFGCPTLIVDTTDGYTPTLNQLAADISALYPALTAIEAATDDLAR